MIIDPNKTYRTRDGRAVRIYATDGAGYKPVHGATFETDTQKSMDGWYPDTWYINGYAIAPGHNSNKDLVEVALAAELTEQIPWEALRPEIQWVAMDADKDWGGYEKEPEKEPRYWAPTEGNGFMLEGVAMPDVDADLWSRTLCKRPEDR